MSIQISATKMSGKVVNTKHVANRDDWVDVPDQKGKKRFLREPYLYIARHRLWYPPGYFETSVWVNKYPVGKYGLPQVAATL